MNEKLKHILNHRIAYQGRTLIEQLEHYHVPALSFAVIEDGQIDCVYAIGNERHNENQPITAETLFQMGSISKMVFTTLILKLYEEGLVDLDEDIHHYLKGITIETLEGQPCQVTLRQILSHTGGLSVSGFDGYEKGESIPDVLEILKGESPANSPKVVQDSMSDGTIRYSGGGFTVAQKIAMDRGEEKSETLMKKYVLEPLGMRLSTYGDPERAFAAGHTYHNELVKGDFHIMPEKAAAGLWSNPMELALYGIHLQKILRGEKGLLQKQTMEQMTTPQVEGTVEFEDVLGKAGLGCWIKGEDQYTRFGHSGWNEGYVALMNLYKYKGQGIVIMLNANEGEPLLYEIQRAITDVYGWEK
ncbi:MAG: serine hydrolase domain-containing protein [Cellulosilyticaceae bacterium]